MTPAGATFLHVADVHLGFDRYDSPERSRDFYLAFCDLLHQYAVDKAVDFVLIAGDLFEYRSILPNVLNQAESALNLLKQAGIPVLAIEGNHDSRPYGVKTSWLRYLADHDFLMLLEPEFTPEGLQLAPWDPQRKRGGYVDLDCGVRVVGSSWFGASAPRSIQSLAAAIATLPARDGSTILMFHHGLEGQIARYSGALRYADLLPLQQAGVNYLALGHIHKSYTAEGWIYNPGSVEANSMAETEYERGAFLVRVEGEQIQAELVKDYYQRPCYRLQVEAQGRETPQQIQEATLALIQAQNWEVSVAPIVEVKLVGTVGFARHELDQRQLQQQIQARTGALRAFFRFEADSLDYNTVAQSADPEQRGAIEEQVFTDLLASQSRYRAHSGALAKLLLALKEMVLEEQPEENLYQHLRQSYADLHDLNQEED